MLVLTISIDSGSEAQVAAVRAEMERSLGCQADPLDILIEEEEDPDMYVLECMLIHLHRPATTQRHR